MKKFLICSLLTILAIVFIIAGTYDVNSTTNTMPMIYRMNVQNTNGSRGDYYNTTRPKNGWAYYTGNLTAPVSTNIANGEAVFYFDYTKSNAGFVGLQKDVSGNLTSAIVFKEATITTLNTTTINLTITGTSTINNLVASTASITTATVTVLLNTTGAFTNITATNATINTLSNTSFTGTSATINTISNTALTGTSATINTLSNTIFTSSTINVGVVDVDGTAIIDALQLDIAPEVIDVTANAAVTINVNGSNYHLLLRAL